MKKKTAKEVKMHKFLARACKSQDFAQIQKKFAQSHDCMTVTFRNSALHHHYPRRFAPWEVNRLRLQGLFLLSPARCLIIRPYADSSELSYS